MATNQHQAACLDYCSPIRNRYFYGKSWTFFISSSSRTISIPSAGC